MEESTRSIMVDTARAIREGSQERLNLYPILVDQILQLATRGWFISAYFGLKEIDKLATSAKAPALEELERCISTLYDDNFAFHLNSIIHRYPDREFILRPAGDAHLRGDYALSVMAFFSQVDGICFDATQRYFFQKWGHIASLAMTRLQALEESTTDNPLDGLLVLFSKIMWGSINTAKPPIGSLNETAENTITMDSIDIRCSTASQAKSMQLRKTVSEHSRC